QPRAVAVIARALFAPHAHGLRCGPARSRAGARRAPGASTLSGGRSSASAHRHLALGHSRQRLAADRAALYEAVVAAEARHASARSMALVGADARSHVLRRPLRPFVRVGVAR